MNEGSKRLFKCRDHIPFSHEKDVNRGSLVLTNARSIDFLQPMGDRIFDGGIGTPEERACQRIKFHRRFVGAKKDSTITLPERIGPSGPTIILHPLTTKEPRNRFWKRFFSKRLERDDIRMIKALVCQRGHDNIVHLVEKMLFMLANLGFGGASE